VAIRHFAHDVIEIDGVPGDAMPRGLGCRRYRLIDYVAVAFTLRAVKW
jgi:hypothetical protein